MTVATPSWHRAFAQRTRADVGEEIARIMALAGTTDVITLSGGFPDPSTFPGSDFAAVLDKVASDATALQYAPTAGLPGFRNWLAERLERLEGLRPRSAEMIVTSGGIEALELVAKSLLDPGDVVLVEGPTYLGAIMAFRSYEAEVVAVPTDSDGLDVDALADLLARRPAKLLYSVPDHQNPAGVSLSAERRGAVVELARRHGVLVLEDVAYRELGFDIERRPSLWALGPDVCAQLGTFSKTFTPGFRMGWVVGPAGLVAQLVLAKQNSDQCTGAFGQRLLEEYDRAGLLDEQIRRACRLYARRCGLLLEAMERFLPEGFTWTRPRGGFFSWVTAPAEVDLVDLYDRALAAGVAYVPGKPFYPDGRGHCEMRLSFSRVADHDVTEGVRRLGTLFAEVLAQR